jgi:hypothetical protein
LEGESPPLGVVVVTLEDVASGSIGPLLHGLADGGECEEGEQSGFACP